MKFFIGLMTIIMMILFVIFPSIQIKGAINGLLVCSDVIIPSLFPFTVLSLFLFGSGFISRLEPIIEKAANLIFKISGRNLSVFLVSFIGGFPVGARLIEEEFNKGNIDKKLGENMLGYCVNSGPAFIIIGVGSALLNSKELGIMLFIANFIASVFIAFLLRFNNKEIMKNSSVIKNAEPLSDVFVEATAKASSSIIGICGFVILFSTLIGVIKEIPIPSVIKDIICALLEVTNGTIIYSKNVYIIAFLLGFAGFSVHFQILSVTKTLKPNYLKFLVFRIFHGFLSTLIFYIALKIHPVSLPVINGNVNFTGAISSISLPFAASLVLLCAVFLSSLKEN